MHRFCQFPPPQMVEAGALQAGGGVKRGPERRRPPGGRWRCARVSAEAARAALTHFRRRRRRWRSGAEPRELAGRGARCRMLTSPPCGSRSSPTRMSSSSLRTRTWRKAPEGGGCRLWNAGGWRQGLAGVASFQSWAPVAGLPLRESGARGVGVEAAAPSRRLVFIPQGGQLYTEGLHRRGTHNR